MPATRRSPTTATTSTACSPAKRWRTWSPTLESDGGEWARAQLEIMRPKSPMSAKVVVPADRRRAVARLDGRGPGHRVSARLADRPEPRLPRRRARRHRREGQSPSLGSCHPRRHDRRHGGRRSSRRCRRARNGRRCPAFRRPDLAYENLIVEDARGRAADPPQPARRAERAERRADGRADRRARRRRGRRGGALLRDHRLGARLRRRRRHQGDGPEVLRRRLQRGLHHPQLGAGDALPQAGDRRGGRLCAGRRLRAGDDVRLHHRRRQRPLRPAGDQPRRHAGRRRHPAADRASSASPRRWTWC